MIEKNVQLDYTFTNGNNNDLEQIKKLTWLAYSQFENVLAEENVQGWKNNLNDDNTYLSLLQTSTCFVCENENKIIGSAFLIPHGNPFKWFDSNCCYIRLVSVHPDFEGNGIGKKLTQLCIDRAKEMNEKVISLHTSEFQHATRHIYESLGFVKIKDLDLMFGKQYYLYTLQVK